MNNEEYNSGTETNISINTPFIKLDSFLKFCGIAVTGAEAKEIILKITKVYQVGERYEAEVYRIESYGAFVRFEDQEGLMHISDVAKERIEKVEDKLTIGQKVNIEIKEMTYITFNEFEKLCFAE